MQDTQVQSPVQEGPTCHVATKPVYYNCWACALEPRSSITEAQATLWWGDGGSAGWSEKMKTKVWSSDFLTLSCFHFSHCRHSETQWNLFLLGNPRIDPPLRNAILSRVRINHLSPSGFLLAFDSSAFSFSEPGLLVDLLWKQKERNL